MFQIVYVQRSNCQLINKQVLNWLLKIYLNNQDQIKNKILLGNPKIILDN